MFVLNASGHKWIELPLGAIFLMLVLATQALAGAEEVYVAKVMANDDNAIIVRGNGEAYLIEKGVGCLSLWRYEGKRVLIVSPGLFLGVGSKLLIPEAGQECRIWDSKSLGSWSKCEDGHWISSVSNGGEILILEDGSVWQVDFIDRINAALWLPTQNVVICGNTMINTDNGKNVGVTQLR